jgi:hypothetical protein
MQAAKRQKEAVAAIEKGGGVFIFELNRLARFQED